MKAIFTYLSSINSIGLLPAIACLIYYTFFQGSDGLYIITLINLFLIVCFACLAPRRHFNLVWVNTTLALCILSALRYSGFHITHFDKDLPIQLFFLLFLLSCLLQMVPGVYQAALSRFGRKDSFHNQWSNKIITLVSALYLVVFLCIFYNLPAVKITHFLSLQGVILSLIYVICILINACYTHILLRYCSQTPILRIAPIYKGKIYVHTREDNEDESGKLDLLHRYLEVPAQELKKFAKDLSVHILDVKEPYTIRFNLRHHIKGANGLKQEFMLYILPLEELPEFLSKRADGRFVSFSEIEQAPDRFSSTLLTEIEALRLAAQTWKDYQ